jgi:hypothetical protein
MFFLQSLPMTMFKIDNFMTNLGNLKHVLNVNPKACMVSERFVPLRKCRWTYMKFGASQCLDWSMSLIMGSKFFTKYNSLVTKVVVIAICEYGIH